MDLALHDDIDIHQLKYFVTVGHFSFFLLRL
jgi:hypothetical protein